MKLLDYVQARRRRKAWKRRERKKLVEESRRGVRPERELERQAAGALWGRDTPRD